MANKGNALHVDDILYEGDYLESDHTALGFFRCTLIEHGLLEVRWHISENDTTGWAIWNSVNQSSDSHYAIMQEDANLCVYNGTPAHTRGLLFRINDRSATPDKTYFTFMQTDGNLTVNGPNGYINGSRAIIQDNGVDYVKSCANGTTKEDLEMSSIPADTGPADDVSVRAIGTALDRRWRAVSVVQSGVFQYFVLINQQTLRAAGADLIQRNAFIRTFDHVIANSRLLLVPNGDSRLPANLVGIKVVDAAQYFNVPGNGPYVAGQPVILYDWVLTPDGYPYPNLLWDLPKVASLMAAPAGV